MAQTNSCLSQQQYSKVHALTSYGRPQCSVVRTHVKALAKHLARLKLWPSRLPTGCLGEMGALPGEWHPACCILQALLAYVLACSTIRATLDAEETPCALRHTHWMRQFSACSTTRGGEGVEVATISTSGSSQTLNSCMQGIGGTALLCMIEGWPHTHWHRCTAMHAALWATVHHSQWWWCRGKKGVCEAVPALAMHGASLPHSCLACLFQPYGMQARQGQYSGARKQ